MACRVAVPASLLSRPINGDGSRGKQRREGVGFARRCTQLRGHHDDAVI